MPVLWAPVARDRSLDEFTGAGSDAGSSPGGPAPDPGSDGADEEGARPDPLAPTYWWSGNGGTCGACGARVEERWRADDAYVCVDCKDW